jgi:hypothetical protein
MKPSIGRIVRASGLATLLSVFAMFAAPAFAQHAGGGGGHGGGGGGHGSVGHFAGGGGGHFAAGRGAYGYRGGYGGYGYGRGYFAGGRYYGRPYWGHGYWGGGWWGGYWWPRAYWGWGWPWFYAALPLGYATYWWGGVPYYYTNGAYYVYDNDYSGYVATDPPPLVGQGGSDAIPPGATPQGGAPQGGPPQGEPGPNYAPPPGAAPPGSSSPDNLYVYPKSGQSDQQAAQDKYECHKWAQGQTGFDPTQPATNSSGNPSDYRRAMIACLEARGYTAK